MNNHFKILSQPGATSSVVALHCSLGSGRQWDRLALGLGGRHQVIAPDICGYGGNAMSSALPTTLAEEIDALSPRLGEDDGPLHIVGHSYGGALGFQNCDRSAVRKPYSKSDAHRTCSADNPDGERIGPAIV
jgi:pimeloyl-ACP methyl ester carboxylesterase